MKITGTKKLLISFFALACALGTGLGLGLSRAATLTDITAYAASDKHVLPMGIDEKASDITSAADIEARETLAEMTGIAPEFISFYARSNNATEKDLYEAYKENDIVVLDQIMTFAEMYADGEIEAVNDISDEDWYVSPDEASAYWTWSATPLGLSDSWGNYYTSKPGGLTTESQYYRNTNFAMGAYTKWDTRKTWTYQHALGKHNCMYYNIVWLDEGEEYEFGFNSLKTVSNVYAEVQSSYHFLADSTLLTSGDYANTYSSYVRDCLFSAYKVNEATVPNPTAKPDPDTSRNTYQDYLDEFGSTIAPTSDSYTFSGAGGATGNKRMKLKADAPSGAYMIVAQVGAYQSGNQFVGMGASNSWAFRANGDTQTGAGYENYSMYCTYATLVCRKAITKPKLAYNEGVSADNLSKTVSFNNEDHELIIENDWGPGLIDYQISEWDGSNWVPTANKNTSSTNVTQVSRVTRGSVTARGQLKFKAKNAGQYKIVLTPFRNWKVDEEGKDESDKDPVEFFFTIKPREMRIPSIMDDGIGTINTTTNTKSVFRTGKSLYISIYPAPTAWTTYGNPDGMSEFDWSTNGVLTMSASDQYVYTVEINLKYNTTTQTNLTWEDGTTAPKVFKFDIGPMKIVVPDIIKGANESGVTTFTKTVEYNGAYQTLSFMPIDDTQVTINAINATTGDSLTKVNSPLIPDTFCVDESTLTLTALNVGRYEMTLSFDTGAYVFDDPSLSEELTYILIITPKPIDAPILNEPTAVNNVKTVTYGGEKMPDGETDWVATLEFINADQSRIDWVSDTLNDAGWLDSTLKLAGRSAKVYDVTFKPKDNYKWKDGVVVPTYTLVIEKLKIAEPQLIKDGESGATYDGPSASKPTSKTVRFDGESHIFKIYFPTLASLKNIVYTKASSVELQYNGTFDREWDGDYVTYSTIAAGEYAFEIFPTQNYCWEDGSSGSKIFNFIIQPIDVKSLEFWATNQFGTGLRQYNYTSNGYNAILNYDGQAKTMRIGNANPTAPAHKYQLTGDYAMYFGILDNENGGFIDRSDEGLTGLAAKLPDGVTCTQDGGYLTLTMTTAGVYKVAVMLNNPNFWWTETQSTQVVYTLTINPEGIPVPVVDEGNSEGNDIRGHFTETSMHGTYYNVNFVFALKLDETQYKDYVKITTPDAQTFVYNTNRTEYVVREELEAALAENKGTYTDWHDGVIYLYAKDQGEYNWVITVTSPNHAWAGKTEKDITFTITIDRSPVSGLEMRYVGDEDENMNVLVQGATNVWGDSVNANTVTYDAAIYSEQMKVIYFKRTSTDHLVDTGFSAQFSYEVNKYVRDSAYDVEDMIDVTQLVFDDGELRLGAMDAGTYEIIITPTDNYCWNDNSHSVSSIKFTLVINKLVIDNPLVIEDGGTTTTAGVKNAKYDHKYLTMQLDLLDWPKGYKIESFEYVSTDKDERDDIVDVKYRDTETGDLDGTLINLGVDPDTGRMSVQAQSAGEYLLTVVVSNVNNYKLAAGEMLLYRFNISRCSVSLPDAFLFTTPLTESEAQAIDKTRADVITMAGSTDASKFDNENTNSAMFDSYYHAVYLYGDDIEKGDFEITVETKTGNGDLRQEVIQPDEIVTGTTEAANYFRLAAFGVDTYTIVLKFKTRDFYWDKDIASSGETRSYKFVITSKLIDVPTIKGESNLSLINNTYTVEFDYTTDSTYSHRMITLTGVEFGTAITGTTPTEYAIINSKISTTSTANGVILTNYPNLIDGNPDPKYGQITMATSLDGITGGEAQVQYVYCIELNIDENNMRWNTGAEGDTLPKYYIIKINKQKIARPYIIDTVNSTGDIKYVTYDGTDWVETLQIALMDESLIDRTLSVSTMTDLLVTTDATYANLLKVTAPAPAGTYTVVAHIIDDDNAEWADGSTDDITFTLEVEKLKVAKPYIYIPAGSTEANEGVVGWTKTVTYDLDDSGNAVKHVMQVGGYWQQDRTELSTSTVPTGTQIPDIMSFEIGNFDFDDKEYTEGVFSGTDYNAYNDGLWSLTATNAQKYIFTIHLSDNALWLDDSDDDLTITLVINKKVHDNLEIYLDRTDATEWCDEVVGNTKTFTYKLDASGDPVEAFMKIVNLKKDLMDFDCVGSGTTLSATPGDGYLEISGAGLGMSADKTEYTVKAHRAGTYEITFKLTDNANHRWAFADTATCTFTLQIKKLKLLQPVINAENNLTNEAVEGNTLTVDYDKNLHTILVESLFDNVNNGFYGGLGAKYFTVADNTFTKNLAVDPAYNSATHLTLFSEYDDTDTLGLKVKNLYEDTTIFTMLTPPYTYTGANANVGAGLINLFRLTAYTPGNYYMTFTLTDPDNMEWSGVTGNEVEFKLVINKVIHDEPAFAGSTLLVQKKEYTGDKVEFIFNNVFNGKMTDGGAVVSTVSEEYAVISYAGNDATLTAASALPDTDPGHISKMSFEVQWFNGTLVLGFTEVGTYKVKISITDTDFIAWKDTNDTSKEFECIVDKRTVKTDVTFSAPSDSELDAKLREHNDVWPITVTGGVGAQIGLSDLRTVPTATTWNQRLGFKVYYIKADDDPDDTTKWLGEKTYQNTDTPVMWTPPIKQSDGTYSLTLWYSEIGTGKGNIKKGDYILHIVQVDTDGNHKLSEVTVPFTVEGDPVPFKTEMLEWVYSRSDDLPGTAPAPVNELGKTEDNRFILTYEEGVTFTFHAQLKSAYRAGYDGSNPPTFVGQLETYFVTWNGSYSDNPDSVRQPNGAGEGLVSIFIKLDEANSVTEDYAFSDYEFILFYKVEKAKYNLSNIEWHYNEAIATAPFTYTYDNTDKSVTVGPKSGATMPTGLVPSGYSTTGTYETANNPGTSVSAGTVATNNIRNAGKYTTTVTFTVTSDNYERPIMGDPDTYEGSFTWTRDWTIEPQHIVVDWTQGLSQSDGITVKRAKPQVAAPYTNFFNISFERQDATAPTGWSPVTTTYLERVPGQTLTYRGTASLKTGNYERNYTFEFLGGDDPEVGNPLVFEVGGDDTEIINSITVDGRMDLDYEYDNRAFIAETQIDFDTSNGEITVADNITLLYFRRDPTTDVATVQLSAAPSEPGNYIVVLKLRYSNTTDDYTLSVKEYIYNIVPAELTEDDFEWRIKHNDGTGAIEARYDTSLGGKWINVDTKEEVTVDYDGREYEVYLYSEYPTSVIRFTYDTNVHYDACNPDPYVTNATAYVDTVHYVLIPNDPDDPTFVQPWLTFTWRIEKHKLDLKDVTWNYEEPFEFTVVNGTPKAFFAEVNNLPEYLSDKVKYTVYRGAELIVDDITDYGNYTTTFEILTDEIDTDNYELGTLPASFVSTLNWEIKRREMELPEDDRSWSEFDGVQHNLLKPFDLAVDWNEYFEIDVTYTDFDGNVTSDYDGSARFGGKYYAYDAGTYKFNLKIRQKFNVGTSADPRNNVVWVVTDTDGTRKTVEDQTVSYTVNKKQLVVTSWIENYELSKVVLAGNIDSTKFIDYKFYKGNTGAAGEEAELNDVLQSGGGDVFSMVPEVRSAYTGNITLTFETSATFISFTTREITADEADKVNGKPYIYGYSINGTLTPFTNDQLASGDLSVTYTGDDITFKIFQWDEYYSKYVTVYGGTLDDLTQREAIGDDEYYTVKLILRSDLEKPLYWGKTADNKIDRSVVELKFRISYKKLTIPDLPEEVTYNGSTINILDKAANSTYSKLLAEYGNYVEITGSTATNVGEQTLYLKIKEEYGNAIRWDDKSAQGIAGTYSFVWKITPILLQKPDKDDSVRIEYDGAAHSVFEVLKGYDAEKPTPAISLLMLYINEVNGRSINAGDFEAVLSLPNGNYSWCDANGNILADRSSVTIPWKISRQIINFDNAYWGYMDGEDEVEYDENSPFTFTIVNGTVKKFTVEILGMPEVLKLYTSYSTNGTVGNSAGAVGTYNTTVVFDLTRLDTNNFDIVVLPDNISQLVWKIEPREFALPEYDGSWNKFDGKVHDLTSLLGLPEDWAEYIDISVEYRATESDSYADYTGEDDYVVGYSNYNGFYVGFYKLTVSFRNGTNGSVKWAGDAPEDIVIEVSERIINVTDWFEDDENSHVIYEGGEELPEEVAERLHYVLYEDGDADKTPLKPEDIVGGKNYCIEYAIKDGRDDKGVEFSYGIVLTFEKGVPNPLEFGTGDFGEQPIIWVPAPLLKSAVEEYNGEAQTFVINDSNAYKLTYAKKNQLNATYSLGLGDDVTSYIYLQNDKALTATSAGTYNAVVRLLSKVRLSWYDSTLYSVDSNGSLVYKSSGITVANAESLFNNKSVTLTYTITPKRVPALTDEDLEKLMGIVIGYDGTEKDVTVEASDVFAELEAKYGKIFDYAGNKGTAADEYELTITLADLGSSYWYSGEPTDEVVSKKRLEGYEFTYVQTGSEWKLVLVKVDKNGKLETDSAGKYVEFNYGEYDADVAYLPDYVTEFVKIKENATDPEGLWLTNADGTVNVANSYWLVDDERVELPDGSYVTYTYEMDSVDSTIVVWYKNDPLLGFIPTTNPADAEYVKRIVLDENADVKYGYKKYKTEDATEYTYLLNMLTADAATGYPMALKDSDGNYIKTYLYFDGTNYTLREYVVDTNGLLIPDGFGHYMYTNVIEATCDMVDSTTYTILGGQFVTAANGEYMLRYVLDGTNRKQQIIYAKDENGNLIVDNEFTVVTEKVYEKVTDKEYNVKWEISSAVLPMPEFDEEKMQQYTGGTLYAKDVLKGFLPDLMEIVEGGEGVDAGEYTAKIIITSPNSKWNPADTTEDYVLVKWHIDTAKIDLSEVKWVYTDGTNTYDDCSEFVYTRKDGKPVVYWVELANLPEALKGKVKYITNNTPGAYAGTDAGRYTTLVEFDTENDPNFDAYEIPETFQKVIDWSIKRRTLDVPEIGSVWMVFDSETHDLLKLLDVPEDWEEYYNIKVQYAENFVDFIDYRGYEGDKYTAYGSGAYKFTLSIKPSINSTVTNPNVVWKTTDIPNPPITEDSGGSGTDASDSSGGTPADQSLEAPDSTSFSAYAADTDRTVSVAENNEVKIMKAETEAVRQEAKTDSNVSVQEVCDRLKELALCAESHIKSFRKYTICARGTV